MQRRQLTNDPRSIVAQEDGPVGCCPLLGLRRPAAQFAGASAGREKPRDVRRRKSLSQSRVLVLCQSVSAPPPALNCRREAPRKTYRDKVAHPVDCRPVRCSAIVELGVITEAASADGARK